MLLESKIVKLLSVLKCELTVGPFNRIFSSGILTWWSQGWDQKKMQKISHQRSFLQKFWINNYELSFLHAWVHCRMEKWIQGLKAENYNNFFKKNAYHCKMRRYPQFIAEGERGKIYRTNYLFVLTKKEPTSVSYRFAKLMQPPPMELIPLICVALPSVRIHSLIGSSLKAATVVVINRNHPFQQAFKRYFQVKFH